MATPWWRSRQVPNPDQPRLEEGQAPPHERQGREGQASNDPGLRSTHEKDEGEAITCPIDGANFGLVFGQDETSPSEKFRIFEEASGPTWGRNTAPCGVGSWR